ncbi:MAG: hypothetical protein U1E52_21490 [Geminicoccaceae bacterium]
MAARLGVGEGSWVELAEKRGRLAISPPLRRYELDELLAGMTPQAMHEAFEWGPDLGRERIDE